MLQKRVLNSIIVICFMFLLIYSMSYNGNNLSGNYIKSQRQPQLSDTQSILDTQEHKESTENIIDTTFIEYENALATIIDRGNKSFFSGYQIDETFLSWFANKYGQESLWDIANYIQDINSDVNKWYEITGKSIHVLWIEYCQDLNIYSYMTHKVRYIDKNTSNKDITIDFVGDINFDNRWHTMKKAFSMENGIEDCFSETVKNELQSADIAVINHEFTFGDFDEALEGKDYVFQAPDESVKYYDMFGTDLVSIANNHIYDYGERGLLNTIEVLEGAGIDHIGAGKNIDEASQTQYYIINGRKIGIISATQIEKFSHFTKEATDKEAGVIKMYYPELFLEKVEKASKRCDYLLAFVHWGNEGTEFFEWDQVELATKMVERGVDAIIGGHPHRLQGCEFIEGVPVAYSLGNFWFSTGDIYTSIAQINISEKGKIKMKMIPCLQENLITSIIDEEYRFDKFYMYIGDISKQVGIDNDGTLHDLKNVNNSHKKDKYKYSSEKNYSKHSSNYDIHGNRIDRVGNLE